MEVAANKNIQFHLHIAPGNIDMLLKKNIFSISWKLFRRHSTLSIDTKEIQLFGRLSNQWFNENGSFKPLHSLNKLRVPWIVRNIPKPHSSLSVIDIGCGGGLLSVPLARAGLNVTGIDATPEAISAAREWVRTPATKRTLSNCAIQYEDSSAETYAVDHSEKFDVVVASEIVEHVADVESFISACVALAKPGGKLFFTTINKTLLSKITAVFFAENVFKIVPEGVHDWNKFVSPEQLTQLLNYNGCHVKFVNGFTYNFVCNEWRWIGPTNVNYGLIAQKK